MIPFPTELLTMGGSALVGAVLKAFDRKADREEKMLGLIHEGDKDRLENGNVHVQWTRRIIALSVVAAVMILPKVAALWGYPVEYGSMQEHSLLWGLFGSNPQSIVWYSVGGMPITPVDTHALMAVVGLYFGGKRL